MDRCGIYVALHWLSLVPAGKVAFFVEEETGGQGSRAVDMDFFQDCSVVLQCDRKGHDDWVQTVSGTRVSSNAFIESIGDLLKAHHYTVTQNGGFTDVGVLKGRGLGVCAANMSCGYYNPHSQHETIHLPALANTFNLCVEVLALVGYQPQVHEYVPYVAPKRENKAYSGGYNAGGSNYSSNYGPAYEKTRRDPFHNNFSPSTLGWTWTKDHPKATYSQVYTKMVLGVEVGPYSWGEVRDFERALVKKQEDGLVQDAKAIKAAKKKLKEWIEWDGTWSINKKDKWWEKALQNPGSEDKTLWIVGYAKRMEDIPLVEAQWQQDWGDWETGGENDSILFTPYEISRLETAAWNHQRAQAKEDGQTPSLFTQEVGPALLPGTQLALSAANVKPGASESSLTVHRDLAAENLDGFIECPDCGADVTDTYEPQYGYAFCASCNCWVPVNEEPVDDNDDDELADDHDTTWMQHWRTQDEAVTD